MSRPLGSLLKLLDRPIAFQRAFVRVTGSITAALFLSQAVYWQNRCDGWFWKTMEQWEDETGMTRSEQDSARKRLRDLGILEEQKRGLPAKIFYRVNEEALQARLQESCNLDCENPASSDAGTLQAVVQESCKLNSETTSETTQRVQAESTRASASATPPPKAPVPLPPSAITQPVIPPDPDLGELAAMIACAHPKSVERQLEPRDVPWSERTAVMEAIAREAKRTGSDPRMAAQMLMHLVRQIAEAVPRTEWRFIPRVTEFFNQCDYRRAPESFTRTKGEMSHADRDHLAEEQRIAELHRRRAAGNHKRSPVDLLPLANAASARRG